MIKHIYGATCTIGENNKFHYVYRITNLVEGKHYYGVRSSKVSPFNDLGTKYFSSQTVKSFIEDQKLNQSNYKYKIIKCFHSRIEAAKLEVELHYTFEVGSNIKFFNRVKQKCVMFDTQGTHLQHEHVDKIRFNMIGRKMCHNPKTNEHLYLKSVEDLPPGWTFGRSSAQKQNMSKVNVKANRGRKWYTNKQTQKSIMLYPHQVTECFTLGRHDQFSKNISKTNTGKSVYHNPDTTEIIHLQNTEIAPIGFVKGLPKKSSLKYKDQNKNKLTGRNSYFNTKLDKEIKLYPSDIIPDGYIKGQRPRKIKNS